MVVQHDRSVDLQRPGLPIDLRIVQGDARTHSITYTLYEGSMRWIIPDGTTAVIHYAKGDGTGGEYDKLPDGTEAIELNDNNCTVTLAEQVLTWAGCVRLQVTLSNQNGQQLSFWETIIKVLPNVAGYVAKSEDYISVTPSAIASELNDLRVDYTGKRHSKAGEAVREADKSLAGQIDKLNEGGLNLKDDVIAADVSNWLDEHPEATTTVQDDSLDEKKLQKTFRGKIKRTYRTFQDVLKDTHLEIGTFIETSGFYNVDDGGGGLYLVSNYAPKDNNPCYFPYGNNYIVYIPEKCICNILALGAKKDGTQDISDIVNNFFASKEVTTKRYYTLYIPSGVYLFNKPIKIENNSVYANIIGCSSSRGEYTFFYNDKVYPRYSSSIFLFDLPSDATSMTVNIAKNGSFNIEGITFASNSATFKNESFTTRPTIPYNIYSIAKNVENVNGLNIESSHMSCVKDCSFIGFSGFGLRSYSHNIFNCFFSDCSIGIINNKSDLMIYSCYITRCENGIKAGSGGVIWASNTFIDQCVEHGILSENDVAQTTLVLNGCIIDHIGYSGICVNNALDANIDARMGRCGMYYAGKTSDFSSLSEDEKKKATTIYYNNLLRGNIRINVYKRSITDDSTDLTYTLPWVVFGGRYNNTIILGLYDSDYSYFCDEDNVHNTAVYTNKGIVTYN